MWARWVVDGDLGYEIDAREIPPDWTTGYVPLRKSKPFEPPAAPLAGQVYALNEPLAEWAFNLTRATPLADTDKLKEIRSQLRRRSRAATALRHHGRRSLLLALLARQAL